MKMEKNRFLRALGFRREVAMVENCRCPLCAESRRRRIQKRNFYEGIREFRAVSRMYGHGFWI